MYYASSLVVHRAKHITPTDLTRAAPAHSDTVGGFCTIVVTPITLTSYAEIAKKILHGIQHFHAHNDNYKDHGSPK